MREEQAQEALPEGAIRKVRMGHLFRGCAEEETAAPPSSHEEEFPEGKPLDHKGPSRNEQISQALTVLVLALSMGKPSLFIIGGLLSFVIQKTLLRRTSWLLFIACMIAAFLIG
ncbi:MAG: hypothetical protein FWD77_05435 [Betaproteobacteria bacterium]|nr:hypothetical protein [Betaproteobacteria bacterium]